MEKDKILENLAQVAKSKRAEKILVSLYRYHHCVTKFADSKITQNLEDDDISIYIKVIEGGHVGVAIANSLNKDALEAALADATAIALHSPAAPQKAFLSKKEDIKKIETYFERTANFTIGDREALVAQIFDDVKRSGFEASGTLLTGKEEMAVVDSQGKALYQPFTISFLKVIAQKGGQTGFASALTRDIAKLPTSEITNAAIRKALLNKAQKEIGLGKYDCILEPEAVAELLEWLGYIGFGAKRFAEHTSFLSGRIEQKIMGTNVTIYDDGLKSSGLAMPFDFEGTPRKKVMLIERGAAKGIVYDAAYGHLYKKGSTGHALTPDSTEGPMPMHLAMAGGGATLDGMISSLKKGILISRFHYVNGFLDPKEALMTGLTRDGTFLIQNGRIKCALVNLRFTDSILEAFNRIAMISKGRSLIGDPTSDSGAILAPTILIRKFTFTGKTA